MFFSRWFRRRSVPAVPPALAPAAVAAVAAAPLAPPASAPTDPRRLEVYIEQIGDMPEHDRAIIISVLQGILDEEAAYERQAVAR